MRSHSTLLNFSNKLFRKCLKAYPRRHQDRFNEEMAQDFRDMCLEVLRERGLLGFFGLWMSVGLDLIKTVFEEHLKIRSFPLLVKMVQVGAFSALLAGATSILLAFTHASPNWLYWVFLVKWIWLFFGSLILLAIFGSIAHCILQENKIGFGFWLSLLGAVFMTVVGLLMPDNIRVWRLYGNGIDILAAGLLIQATSDLHAKSLLRWNVIRFALGCCMLIFNQLTPPRHMGLLFAWDGALFASLMGIAWIVFGLALFDNRPKTGFLFSSKENKL